MRSPHLRLISNPRARHRAHEWTNGKAVTFIVTLASGRSVTLAARAAGMSRKSAYALKDREPAFRIAWKTAASASRTRSRATLATPAPQALAGQREGDSRALAAPSTPSTSDATAWRRAGELQRDQFFARLARARSERKTVSLPGDTNPQFFLAR